MASPGPLRFPSIDGLRAFEATARLGGYERAAAELHVTASAVGKRVAAVEDLLGQPLFTRQGNALALTAGGREYLEQVRAALGLLAAMPQHQRAVQRLRRLRVSAPPTFARQLLVPGLEAYTRDHPDIELEVVLSVPFLDLQAGDADVVVRTADAATLADPPLLDDVVLPMAAPALLQRLPPLDRADDLLHAPLLRTPIEPWSPWLRAAGLPPVEPTAGPRLVDLGLALEAAVAAQGVVLGRPSLARHWLAAGSLKPLFGPLVRPTQLYAVQADAADEAAQRFTTWLRGHAAALAAEGLALVHRQLAG